jgi:hypothetical protein
MDSLVAMAYAIAALYVGFVVGLFFRGSDADRSPPDGGEPPAPEPPDPGPQGWAMWEREFAGSPVT